MSAKNTSAALAAIKATITKAKDDDAGLNTIGYTLGELGEAGLDTAIAAATSKRAAQQEIGAYALGAIPEAMQEALADRALPPLIALLGDASETTRRVAATVLERWNERAAPAAAMLIKLLDDADEPCVDSAIDTLGSIGPGVATKPAIAKLVKLAAKENFAYRAVAALGRVGIGDKAAHAAVASVAKSGGYSAKRLAQRVMGELAKASIASGSGLTDEAIDGLMESGRATDDWDALVALGAKAMPRILRCISDDDSDVRYRGLIALGAMGALAVPHIATVASHLAADDEDTRNAALSTMGKIGAKAVPVLSKSLAAKQAEIRRGAANALAALGRAGKSAAAALVIATKDKDAGVAAAARTALAAIAPEKLPAAAKLDKKLVALAAITSEKTSPLAYATTTPPAELVRLWIFATAHDDVPCGLELRVGEGSEKAWLGPKRKKHAEHLVEFSGDGDGGLYALWLAPKRTLATAPVVFLGGEGETAVLADSMSEFLELLASGHGRLGTWVAGGRKDSFDATDATSLKTYRAWLKRECKIAAPSAKRIDQILCTAAKLPLDTWLAAK